LVGVSVACERFSTIVAGWREEYFHFQASLQSFVDVVILPPWFFGVIITCYRPFLEEQASLVHRLKN